MIRILPILSLVAGIAAADPYFSEYVEGSSFNKAIELANPGATALDLSGYALRVYFNGNSSPTFNQTLAGSIPPGGVWVLAATNAAPALVAAADATTGASLWNGDDALVLVRLPDTVVDSIGQVGVDPGTQWISDGVGTVDRTLRRLVHPSADPDPTDPFLPSLGWAGFPIDTFDHIGVSPFANGPDLSLALSPINIAEGGGEVLLTLSRDGGGGPLSVALLSSEPATLPVPSMIEIAAGQTEVLLVLSVIDDALPEADATVTITASVAGSSAAATLAVLDDDAPVVTIAQIQGAGHSTQYAFQVVQVADAIVTAVAPNAFWMQEDAADDDGDPATSEGIYVFTGSAPGVAVGDLVRVRGQAREWFPDGLSGDGLSYTQLSSAIVTVLGSGQPLPEAVVIGAAGRQPPMAVIDDDGFASFDPADDGIDFHESLEGMRVAVQDALVTAPTNGFGEIWVLPDGGAGATSRTLRGGALLSAADANPERVQIDDQLLPDEPQVEVGDRFAGSVVGVLHYGFDEFRIYNTEPLPAAIPGGLLREITSLPARWWDGLLRQVRVASMNVENLHPADPRVAEHAAIIVQWLDAPTIICLEEIQDASGSVNDGTVAGVATGQALIDAILAAGGPAYSYIEIAPMDNADGGAPGGNIRVAMLYRAPAVLRPGIAGGATEAVAVLTDGSLSLNPGRIAPTDLAFANSRKPLAAEFLVHGRRLLVIANHFNSKGGDQPLYGRFQPPALASEAQRVAQAAILTDFVHEVRVADRQALVVVAGDLNDFPWSAPLAELEAVALGNLHETLAPGDRYSYNFRGNHQVLDHILTSPALRLLPYAFDAVHANAGFLAQSSDHDPLLSRLTVVPRLPGWLANLLLPAPGGDG